MDKQYKVTFKHSKRDYVTYIRINDEHLKQDIFISWDNEQCPVINIKEISRETYYIMNSPSIDPQWKAAMI